jgi:alkanesulfonate monooxygenase SsuD/methylene tetrahydromethanopterin reductase-like flavin-dependent oxidoreductase (luciferase family)
VGEKYDFEGKHYQLKDSPALPKPVQQPHPPIIVGGAGKKRTPALAAQYAAEFNAGFRSVEDTVTLFARVQAASKAIGRDPQTLALSTAHTVVVGKDDAEVKRRAAAIGREVEELKQSSIAGTPAEVVDRLGQYAAAGSQRQYVQIMDLADLDHLDLIASEVLPQVS